MLRDSWDVVASLRSMAIVTKTTEWARTADLEQALRRIAPALEQFLRFEGPDLAAQRSSWRPRLDQPMPQRGRGAQAVIDTLCDVVIPHGLRLGASGFCGWVTTMPPVIPAVTGLVGSVTANQRWWSSPGNFLEQLGARWIRELLGFSDSHVSTLCSGGAEANLLGLCVARQHAGEARGCDPATEGVSALVRPRIYAGTNVHQVVTRALSVLGFGRDALQRIPVRTGEGMVLGALERAIDRDLERACTPIAVVASAGDTHTGCIDAIDAIRKIAHTRGIWLHIDGAYGGFGVLDERVRERYGALDQADSLVVDPHKWLATPVGCGALVVRDGRLLKRACALEKAHYLPYERRGDRDPASAFDHLGEGSPAHSLAHSAPSRGLWIWATLMEIGVDGVRARVARHLDCARHVAKRVQAHEALELLAEPTLSICCFRYHPPTIRDQGTLERLNRTIIRGVRARGRCIPSSTRVDNKLAIRPCFLGPRTTLTDADALVDEVLLVADAALDVRHGVNPDQSPRRRDEERSW